MPASGSGSEYALARRGSIDRSGHALSRPAVKLDAGGLLAPAQIHIGHHPPQAVQSF
jgi:hypothetical protein